MKMQMKILFVLIACLIICFASGCGVDLRKGGGSVFSAYLGVDVLKAPASVKMGVGNQQANAVASHEPPDFSDAGKYKNNSQTVFVSESDSISTSNAAYYASLKQESDRLFYGSRDK